MSVVLSCFPILPTLFGLHSQNHGQQVKKSSYERNHTTMMLCACRHLRGFVSRFPVASTFAKSLPCRRFVSWQQRDAFLELFKRHVTYSSKSSRQEVWLAPQTTTKAAIIRTLSKCTTTRTIHSNWKKRRPGTSPALVTSNIPILNVLCRSPSGPPEQHTMTFLCCKKHLLEYKMVNTNKESDRVAEIYQQAIDEMHGNSEYEWHQDAECIHENVASGK